MATDTITAVPTITTVRSKNPTTMSRKGDSVRARLLNNMGIFKGATTPSQSAAPNPAIERKMKIIRAMGMGGVIPTKPPTRDDFQQKSGNGMMMMMADGSINMNASGNEARFRPKIDFDKITEEALKYTDYKWDDNDIDDLHHDHESVSEENDLDNDNDNDNHMLDLVGDCDASASSVGSRSTSTSRSRSNSNVSTGSAMSICSNGSTAASSRPGDSVVDDSSDSSSFKPKTIGVGAVSVAVSVSVSANASTVSASASSTTSNTKPTRRKARISFNDSVAVAHIPMRSEYSDRVRSRLWSNRYEIHENATRNAIEFQAEGWDWRSVTEDEGMFVCTSSGELIHPVHCQQ